MKKGPWIAIVLMGLLSVFSMVSSFLLKQKSEMQTRQIEEVRKHNKQLEEQLRLTIEFSALKEVKYQMLIDSLKGDLKSNN